MNLVQQGAVRFMQFNSFDTSKVAHAIFTRHGGVSPQPYASLNVSVSTGDARENVRQNVALAFGALERDPASCADLWQGDSARVVVGVHANGPLGDLGQAHSLITDPPQGS